ncbi:sodium/glutamate symporter [Lentibacillus saliphilus]|uniref:sodium/glutamate symporter n=1 Tax=Lentibacillus saliphilus TaxID=2737028 RepID=UPI001C2F589C|nr:sodium/glutamate symporter [Lentibacillus saliphilus]
MTLWDVLIDVGFISMLLLVGTLLRAKVKFIQKLFLPASLIAGFLGLILGPNALGVIPFSEHISTYASILIAIIFGALPFTSKIVSFKKIIKSARNMWAFSQVLTILEWAAGMLFALLILNFFWSGLPDGFGLMLAAGLLGGHGTAAAIATGFGPEWEGALSVGMTSATVGIVASIVGGILIIKRETRRGRTSFINDFNDLPNELRTGLVEENKRHPFGFNTVSSASIDPLMYHSGLLLMVAMIGYYLSQFINDLIPQISVPVFSTSFIVGYIVLFILRAFNADYFFDKNIFERTSGTATDLLVAFGIASIKLSVVVDYALPLAILLIFGIAFVYFMYAFVAPKFFHQYPFEKSIFCWGWGTGTVAMGMALLRIVDPELKSKTLDEYGLAYIPIGFMDILIIALAPMLIISGQHWLFTFGTLSIGLAILVGTYALGWWGKTQQE